MVSMIESTYHLKMRPDIHPSVLGVNYQIHNEAANVLYSSYVFDFATDVECVVPFFQDLTPIARSSIRHIGILKRALPYTKDFDRCEWTSACTFIAENLQLSQLDLGVEGGKPLQQWEAQETYTASEFSFITDYEGMEWIRPLCAINRLDTLVVRAHLEHCPPPHNSRAMALFVNFSASIEHGFAEYLRGLMLKG